MWGGKCVFGSADRLGVQSNYKITWGWIPIPTEFVSYHQRKCADKRKWEKWSGNDLWQFLWAIFLNSSSLYVSFEFDCGHCLPLWSTFFLGEAILCNGSAGLCFQRALKKCGRPRPLTRGYCQNDTCLKRHFDKSNHFFTEITSVMWTSPLLLLVWIFVSFMKAPC